ncbi:hypothetical protein [Calidifontibacillus erzurumensis]|uniref:Uncharacterized protein n=1 Tax=Calidifontibacillus erzurumensis TaxID=2741433 RepID=A0A8J8GDY5_9BACI|nr:hypothetical protein [Calidifontibacillus erzurumensis]NSL51902.1 hypothetical protein [Calidifontibacillus erzurumensis]
MAEKVIFEKGYYEVDPARMQHYVKQTVMNDAECRRIIKCRTMYLEWMLNHFSDGVPAPPEEE